MSGSLTVTTAPAGVQTSSAAAAQSASSSSTDAQQKAYEQKRLAEIKKLKFDRRPSARIQAWAAPEKTDAKQPEEKQKPTEQPSTQSTIRAPTVAYEQHAQIKQEFICNTEIEEKTIEVQKPIEQPSAQSAVRSRSPRSRDVAS